MAFDLIEVGGLGASVDTTDASPTRLFEMDMSNFDELGMSSMGVVAARMTIIAGRTSGHFHARLSRFAVKMVTGTPTFITAEVVESEDSEETWTVATSIDGTKFAVDVTGEADTTIAWRCQVSMTYGGFSPS